MKKQTTLKFQFFFLILLLVVPTFSASLDDTLNPPSPASRVKTLVLGECALDNRLLVDDNIQSDFGLFVFDVVSDIVNGVNFIEDCNPIWGSVIIGIIFLPITVYLAWFGFVREFRNGSCLKKVLLILLLPLYGPVAIALATPAYIIYVAYVLARRVVQPSYVDQTFAGNKVNQYAQFADYLKLFEAILEANLQAITGATLISIYDCNIALLNKKPSLSDSKYVSYVNSQT